MRKPRLFSQALDKVSNGPEHPMFHVTHLVSGYSCLEMGSVVCRRLNKGTTTVERDHWVTFPTKAVCLPPAEQWRSFTTSYGLTVSLGRRDSVSSVSGDKCSALLPYWTVPFFYQQTTCVRLVLPRHLASKNIWKPWQKKVTKDNKPVSREMLY